MDFMDMDFIDGDILLSVLLCWHLKDCRGQMTPEVFDILITLIRN